MAPDAEYLCDTCGELIVIPVDPSAGKRQQYVEDCPVCCSPNLLSLVIEDTGNVIVECRPESQDGRY